MVGTTYPVVSLEDGIEEKVTDITDQKKIEDIIMAVLQQELGIDVKDIKITCNGNCRLKIRERYVKVQSNYKDLDEFKKVNNL